MTYIQYSFNPLGRPAIMAGSDHYFHTCPYVRTFQNHAKQDNFQVRILIAIGGAVDLTEWIVDD